MKLNPLLLVLVFPLVALAEMPSQDPQKADVIAVGRVEVIDKRSDIETDYFTISIRLEAVERGSGVAVGDAISVNTFKWARPGVGKVGASGHKGRPNVDDKIRFYAYSNGGVYRGSYPNWFELLEASTRPPAPYTGDSSPPIESDWWKTFWSTPLFYVCLVVIVLIGFAVGVLLWERKPPTPPTPAAAA